MAKRKTKKEIAPSIPEGTRESSSALIERMELTEPPEPCRPIEYTPDGIAAIALWNGALARLDAQRELPTVAEQAQYIASVVNEATYVLALVPTEETWTFTWVKGYDDYDLWEVEDATIDTEAVVFIMPNEEWTHLLMIGHGDCEPSMQHRDKAIWNDGQGASQSACELTTVKATESFFGPQPGMADEV